MRVALINTNRMHPPVAPVGLEYLAENLERSGIETDVLDLCWSRDPLTDIDRFFAKRPYALAGLTLRNTDDCAYPGRREFIEDFAALAGRVRRSTDAVIVAGGAGFSCMPQTVLEKSGLDAGIRGDGEFAFGELAGRIRDRREWRDLPGLIVRSQRGWAETPPRWNSLHALPALRRDRVDQKRYFREGGQAGFESKRGCSGRCVYCADPVAKGNRIRLRSPSSVADEIENLLALGIDHLHTLDSEFNRPESHARSVCRELIRRGLGHSARWYAYAAPAFFSRETARSMRRAGCAGINFGADHADPAMLKRLGRMHEPGNLADAARFCRENGIACMFDLILGSPGESRESLKRAIDFMKRLPVDRVGVTVGVRVYPGTPLAGLLARKRSRRGLTGGNGEPLFFLEPAVRPWIASFLEERIGVDERFLFFNPENDRLNYNYNANEALIEAIRKGARGAYWDILRKTASGADDRKTGGPDDASAGKGAMG